MEQLIEQRRLLEKEQRNINDKLKEINIEIRKYKQLNYPKCSNCGVFRHERMMWIATQEDIIDQNEGYSGPVIGEYYCGC